MIKVTRFWSDKYVPPPINFYQIILIDEGSMVNDETAKELIGYVKEVIKH
jgi:hypothetical protein